ncbi:MAG: hypothetical protein ACNI27_10630 [Desulfovibrio sp.]
MRQEFSFNLHDLLRVRCIDLPKHLEVQLNADYGWFKASKDDFREEGTELVVYSLEDASLPPSLFRPIKGAAGRWYADKVDGRVYAVLTRLGETCAVVALDGGPVLYCSSRPEHVGGVLDALFAAVEYVLVSHGAMLCKGAVLVREEQAVVLTGLSGAGKTSAMLRMMGDGWDYLSDNTFILYEGQALAFRRHIVVHHYHLEHFSEYFSLRRERKLALWRRCLARVVSVLPSAVQASKKVQNLCDPYVRLGLEEVNPERGFVPAAPIVRWVLLLAGAQYTCNVVEDDVRAIRAVHDMVHTDYVALRQLHDVYGSGESEVDLVLTQCLGNADKPLIRVCLPDLDSGYGAFCRDALSDL